MNSDFESVVIELVRELDKRKRVQARSKLLKLRRDPTVKVLRSLLRSEDVELRMNAAEAMLRIDPAKHQKDVLPLLDAREEIVRSHICGLLYDFGDKWAVPGLVKALVEDRESEVRLMAVYALEKLGDQSCLTALKQAAEFDDGRDHEGRTVKRAALDAIIEINRRTAQ